MDTVCGVWPSGTASKTISTTWPSIAHREFLEDEQFACCRRCSGRGSLPFAIWRRILRGHNVQALQFDHSPPSPPLGSCNESIERRLKSEDILQISLKTQYVMQAHEFPNKRHAPSPPYPSTPPSQAAKKTNLLKVQESQNWRASQIPSHTPFYQCLRMHVKRSAPNHPRTIGIQLPQIHSVSQIVRPNLECEI